MSPRPKILFLTPGAEPTGANIFLLRFLEWFSANCDIRFEIFFGRKGELESKYRELCKSFGYEREKVNTSLFRSWLTSFEDKSGLWNGFLKQKLRRENYDLVFSNTVANHHTLPLVSDLGVPIITHCHEMECTIRLTGIEGVKKTMAATEHFVAVSNAVRDQLIGIHGLSADRVSVLPGFVPIKSLDQGLIQKKEETKVLMGLPPDSFLVGASGTLDWRKAPEVFIRVANTVLKKENDFPIYFVWIGGASEGDNSLFCARYDVEKLDLTERVKFFSHTLNPFPYFAALDVFAMVSREDPFPLVCLESAAFGVPIVCFENAGGMPEFVGKDCGFAVPYLDTDTFADKILLLCREPGLQQQLGNAAAQKVRENHDLEKEAPKLLNIIRKYI